MAWVAAGLWCGFDLNFDQPNQPAAASTTTPRMVTMTPIGAPRFAFGAAPGAGAVFAALAAFGVGAAVGSGGASGASYEPLMPRSSAKMSDDAADGGAMNGTSYAPAPPSVTVWFSRSR